MIEDDRAVDYGQSSGNQTSFPKQDLLFAKGKTDKHVQQHVKSSLWTKFHFHFLYIF